MVELSEGSTRDQYRAEWAATLARAGDHARAAAEAGALAGRAGSTGAVLYNAACAFSLSSAAARQDRTLSEAERARRAEGYAARALELLAQADAAGYFKDPAHVSHMHKDPDLDPLRARPDFQKLAAGWGAKGRKDGP
jgi:hypothetical protein